MKTIRLYWLSSLLVIASVVLASKAVQAKKNVELLKSQVISSRQAKAGPQTQGGGAMTDAELIEVRQFIEALAARHDLPLAVKLDKGTITIDPQKEQGDGELSGPPGESSVPGAGETGKTVSTESVSATKNEVLRNYGGLMAFVKSLSSLPYPLEYKSFCIGQDCTTGFEVIIEAKKNQ